MTSTEVAVAENASLALDPDQTHFTEPQIKALEHIGVENASHGDLQVFHHVCQRSGLDPFARQIHMIGRQVSVFNDESGQWEKVTKQTIQTGIDGFRLIGRRAANAANHTVSVGAPEWAHEDGTWRPVWMRAWGEPVAARVTIKRGGEPFTAVALFDEYKQTKRNGELTSMWNQRPAGQLAKCAEALAWRMAFPQDLSGLYVDEEMQQADNVVPGEVVQQRTGGLGAALDAEKASDPDRGGEAGSGSEHHPPSPDPDGAVDADEVDMITDAQMRNIGRLMGKGNLNITDADEARVKCSVIIGREIKSRKELTKDEAGKVINELDFEVTSRQKAEAES